jgi:hypothetical protein
MSCTQSWWLAEFLICLVLIGNAFVMLTFLRYCELMAKNEARESEWAEIHSDEYGLNEYKKAQWHRLHERPYLQFADRELNSKGERLRYYIPMMMAPSFIVVIAVVVLDIGFCK